MNSAITFPPPRPTLRLTRSPHAAMSDERWAATLAEERRRLLEDQEELRLRESNLREYEARLRALQAEIEATGTAQATQARTPARATATPFNRPSSRTPFENDAALQGAWDKLHRAREILEAEQAHIRDERIILADQQNEVKRREDTVTTREERVAEREKLVAAAVAPETVAAAVAAAAKPADGEPEKSAVARLTSAPFAMARSVFGGKK